MLKHLALLRYLAWSEIKKAYSDTAGGVLWAFFAPVSLIGAMWLALDFGLGLRRSVGPEYGIALITGLTTWFLFSDSVNDATSSVVRNPHLVKQVVFPVTLLPFVSVGSALFVHLGLISVLILILMVSGAFNPAMFWTLPFWMAISIALCAGVSLLFSSINVVMRDAKAAIPFIITVWFWLTPIVWPMKNVPADLHWLVAFNPMAIVIEGYRTALTGSVFPFDLFEVVIGIGTAAILLKAGWMMFQVLQPRFADNL